MKTPSLELPRLDIPKLPFVSRPSAMDRVRSTMPSLPAMPTMPWDREAEMHSPLVDGALLLLRVGAGSLLVGHGSQKLFGWFGGHGLQGTGQWLESMGLKPGMPWAIAAAGGEFGGGLLTALGLGGPMGPIGIISAMSMATAKAHWGKPIWVTSGGAELPVAYMSIAGALALAGHGKYSLDNLLGIKVHWTVPAILAAVGAAAVTYGMMSKPEPAQQEQLEEMPEHAEEEPLPLREVPAAAA